MEALFSLIGAIAGAVILLAGQASTRRTDDRKTRNAAFVEHCATIIALEEDFRNRLWEERRLGLEDRVVDWNLGEFRLAAARLRILSTDQHLVDSYERLHKAGGKLGGLWRKSKNDNAELEEAWQSHKAALESFISVASRAFRS